MENRLLENRLLAENGHSRNRRFAGVATAFILLGVAVVCVVTYKVGPGAGAYDAVEMLSKGEEANQKTAGEISCDACHGEAGCVWDQDLSACYNWPYATCSVYLSDGYKWCPEGATSPPTEAPTRAPPAPTAAPTAAAPTAAPTAAAPTPPTTPLLTEGYYPGYSLDEDAMAAACTSNWRIAAGAFQQKISDNPPRMDEACDTWLVLGGAKVGSGDNYQKKYTTEQVYDWMHEFNYKNVDFDMEGVLEDANDEVLALATSLKDWVSGDANLHNVKFQFTIMGSFSQSTNSGQFKFLENNHGTFDTIALMLYGNFMNGAGWVINDEFGYTEQDTWKWLMEWVNAATIPNKKIMIGLTWLWDDTGKLTPGWVINAYKQVVAENGLKGLFFWDASLTPQTMKPCLETMGTSCPPGHPVSDGPPPAPHSRRCGADWGEADEKCGNQECIGDEDCTEGNACYKDLAVPCTDQTGKKRCGNDWTHANNHCENKVCRAKADCGDYAGDCYKDLKFCANAPPYTP